MPKRRHSQTINSKKLMATSQKSRFPCPIRRLYRALNLFKREITSPVKVDLMKRLYMWSHGFLGESYVIYDIEKNELRYYLSDYSRWVRTPDINGEYSVFLTNKMLFSNTLVKKGYNAYLPRTYATIDAMTVEDFLSLLREKKNIVLKPMSAGGGHGFILVSKKGSKIYVNKKEETEERVRSVISNLRSYLVQEYVAQARYASNMFPKTTNTIRILTMWDIHKNLPFVAAAAHRIGTYNSFPVDNCTQGGLSADINLQTGRIGKAVAFPHSGELVWYKEHPDTGSRIEGILIPRWSNIKNKILSIASSLSFIPYIGWDIIVTEKGFKILEGNAFTGVHVLQVHRPLLLDQRTERFYKKYRVI